MAQLFPDCMLSLRVGQSTEQDGSRDRPEGQEGVAPELHLQGLSPPHPNGESAVGGWGGASHQQTRSVLQTLTSEGLAEGDQRLHGVLFRVSGVHEGDFKVARYQPEHSERDGTRCGLCT